MALKWLLSLLAFTGAFLAVQRPCHADARAIEWTVTRPPEAASCPDAAALTDAVAKARGGPDPARESAAGAIALEVEFARAGAGFAATVRTRGPRGGVRTLSGPTCAALTDAVVATIAVLLDDAGEEPSVRPPPTAAPASGPETPPADEEPRGVYLPLRIGLAAHAGLAYFHRSSSSPTGMGGAALGGELRVHPYSRHGGAFAITYGGGVFGPNVTLIDAAYSYALTAPRPIHGLSSAVYLDAGPALGLVSHAGPSPDHSVLGGRVSVTADAQLAIFTIGITAGYHGGVPLSGARDGWEGAFTAMLRAGLVFDFGTGNGQ